MSLVHTTLLLLATARSTVAASQANVIIMTWDDVGWNDFGMYSTDMGPNKNWNGVTPYATELARDGISFSKHYTAFKCTPTRCSLHTGRYTNRYGLDGEKTYIGFRKTVGLDADETLIAEEFRAANFSTYIVGKWHLGYSNVKFRPFHRGFDSCFTFNMGGQLNYWEKTISDRGDLWINDTILSDDDPYYDTSLQSTNVRRKGTTLLTPIHLYFLPLTFLPFLPTQRPLPPPASPPTPPATLPAPRSFTTQHRRCCKTTPPGMAVT